jgi:hypothetical protein
LFNEDNNPEEIREEKRKIKKEYALTSAALDLVAICLVFFFSSFLFLCYCLQDSFSSGYGATKRFLQHVCMYNATICKTFLEYGTRK